MHVGLTLKQMISAAESATVAFVSLQLPCAQLTTSFTEHVCWNVLWILLVGLKQVWLQAKCWEQHSQATPQPVGSMCNHPQAHGTAFKQRSSTGVNYAVSAFPHPGVRLALPAAAPAELPGCPSLVQDLLPPPVPPPPEPLACAKSAAIRHFASTVKHSNWVSFAKEAHKKEQERHGDVVLTVLRPATAKDSLIMVSPTIPSPSSPTSATFSPAGF